MVKLLSFYYALLLIPAAALSLFLFADPSDTVFQKNPSPAYDNQETADETFESLYDSDDWNRYITGPEYSGFDEKDYLYEDDVVNVLTYGSMNLNMTYGKSFFTKEKYRQYDEDKPRSRVISEGFYPEQLLLLHVEGNIGRRMTVFIDHDSRKDDNRYMIQYRAVDDDEFVREINAGEIDIKFDGSKYAVYENHSAKGMGVDARFRKGDLEIQGFGTISRGIAEVELFSGAASPGNTRLSEFQYISGRYYQLEPFVRFDSLTGPGPDHQVYTSSDPDIPRSAVNIEPSEFELYLDDQNPYEKSGSIVLELDGGEYTRLSSGTDYRINYSTGVIELLRHIPDRGRVFAVYNTTESNDPFAGEAGQFPGRNFVFLKYGPSVNDAPPVPGSGPGDYGIDDKRDIYELRSFYYTGARDLKPDNLRVNFFRDNSLLSKDQIEMIGRYSVNYNEGLIEFEMREPFRNLTGSRESDEIYTERQASNVYIYSRYSIRVDYYREARSFKLRHFNIVPDSVRVKVNGVGIPESLYSVDYTTGYIVFVDPNRPVIVPETGIEISYERLPIEGQTDEFTGGVRAEYDINRDITVGGSLIYSGNAPGEAAPRIGSEPEYTLMMEADLSARAGPERLAGLYNLISGDKVKTVPAELNLSAEIARSYTGINTFGRALVDDMESADEIFSLSTSEKEWVLSSRPEGYQERAGDFGEFYTQRSMLNYYFYRSISDTTRLRGIDFNAKKIDYSVKPGPYNVAYGHIPGSIEDQSTQRSLVLDFEEGAFASIVTRKLSDYLPVDMSGLQYVEISYRYESENNGDIELFLDLGKICEDSDGDGQMDTEDRNNTGMLDKGDDRGYTFNEAGHPQTVIGGGPRLNSSTMGDGVLNTEDLNWNGRLDIRRGNESVFTIPSDSTQPGAGSSVISSGGGWQKMRIYIDPNSGNSEILRQVESVRLYIAKEHSVTGKLYIDEIRFVSPGWRDPEFNGSPAGPDRLRVTMINSISDPEYRTDSFVLNVPGVYRSLYGDRSGGELKRESETAMQIEYAGESSGEYSITRRFSNPFDIRHYGFMHIWMNFREYNQDDKVRIRIGSTDNDYIEYEFDMSVQKTWKEIKLALNRSSSGGALQPVSIEGVPDMKRVRIIKLIIEPSGSADGQIWVNNIYVSDPDTLSDSAHWYEAGLKIKRPLYYTASGVPVFSDIDLRYVKRGHGSDFNTIGKVEREIKSDAHELYASTRITPDMFTNISYFREKISSDPLDDHILRERRGDTVINSFNLNTDYTPSSGPAPSVSLIYRYENYGNRLYDSLSTEEPHPGGGPFNVTANRQRVNHSPVITMRKTYDDFFGGRLRADCFYDGLFKDEAVQRESDNADSETLSDYISPEDREKIQRGRGGINLHYTREKFFIAPSVSFGSEEVVYFSGEGINITGIEEDVRGGYHFPFLYGDDFRFTERNKNIAMRTGIRDLYIFSPEYSFNFTYRENRFSDRTDEGEFMDRYPRTRDTGTHAGSSIKLPVNLKKYNIFKNIIFFDLNYSRSLFLNETGTPYEGESKSCFREDFGISHVFSGMGSEAYDFFSYYPGYFFTGRGNYAGGRDMVYSVFNEGPAAGGEPVYPDYNNRLRLVENFSLNSSIVFDPVTVYVDAGLYQSTERSNIEGVPVQLVSRNSGVTINTDLMKILSFGFFRPNEPEKAHHSSFIDLGYSYTENMFITSNIEEIVHSPSLGLTFKRNRSQISFGAQIDMRFRNDKEYISYNEGSGSSKDDIYIDNMPEYFSFHEKDYGYTYTVFYETEVRSLYDFFSGFYQLVTAPVFSTEYRMGLNRYDYKESLSPEPYDLYMLTSRLSFDVHENVQGAFSIRAALERFRDRIDNSIVQEVFSCEAGFHFTLIF